MPRGDPLVPDGPLSRTARPGDRVAMADAHQQMNAHAHAHASSSIRADRRRIVTIRHIRYCE